MEIFEVLILWPLRYCKPVQKPMKLYILNG